MQLDYNEDKLPQNVDKAVEKVVDKLVDKVIDGNSKQ
jgi:hypothetical protein